MDLRGEFESALATRFESPGPLRAAPAPGAIAVAQGWRTRRVASMKSARPTSASDAGSGTVFGRYA